MAYPGKNTYKNGFIVDDPDFELKFLNSAGVQEGLHKLGEEFIAVAQIVYEGSTKDDPDAPPRYNESFSIKDVHRDLLLAIQVYNSDVTAEWVEFGAHAGGKTAVLKYRVLGHAADIMEARANGKL
jgi:hypothetical protein